VYQWLDLKHSLIVLGLIAFNFANGMKAYSHFESWETTDWDDKMFLITGTLCAVALPFQISNAIQVYRQYDRKPYQLSDFWFTITVLCVGTCSILTGLITYSRIEIGEKRSVMDKVVMTTATIFAGGMLFGVPYAYFQYHHLEGREKNTKI
jgi:hypothetical protein